MASGGNYVPPTTPGYSGGMKPELLDAYEFPDGSAWTQQTRSSV